MNQPVKLLSRVQLFGTPWTVAFQDPQSMEFSRQEYWSGLPFPSPGDLPDPGTEPRFPTLQAVALPSESPGKPNLRPLLPRWTPCVTVCWVPYQTLHMSNHIPYSVFMRQMASIDQFYIWGNWDPGEVITFPVPLDRTKFWIWGCLIPESVHLFIEKWECI